MLKSVELGLGDGRGPLLCAFDTAAFCVVEGEENAQVVLEEKIDGRRNGRVSEKSVCILNGLEIVCLQELMLSEARDCNRCHVALRDIGDNEEPRFQKEIENAQYNTGTRDSVVASRPLLEHILKSHITSHLHH